jgi:hypothetical protein
MRRFRGLNMAATAKVEATMATWDSLPIKARNSVCRSATLLI